MGTSTKRKRTYYGGVVQGNGAFAPPMWKHQEQAVDFALERASTLFYCGLGTGKSRCAIEVAEKRQAKKVLILCPLSVIPAWEKQFREYAYREWEVVLLSKGAVAKKTKVTEDALRRSHQLARPVAVVVNYESARSAKFAALAMKTGWDLLICDEIHRLKSPSGQTSRWVSRLAKQIKTKLGLSGTIMPHSPMDVYGQMRTLKPTIFGWSFVRFRRRYAKMGGWGGKQIVGYQNMDELRSKMADITFQVGREVLDLPPANHERIYVELSKEARRVYEDLSENLIAHIDAGECTASTALVALLRLQQLTSGVATVDGDPPQPVRIDESKRKALVDLFDALPADEPVVVFGRFRADMDTVHLAAQDVGRESLELSGKRRELEAWQEGGAPILATQIQAGGVGVDLTRAAYCVFLSTGFSLGDFLQAEARVHRPGADRPVFYFHFLAQETIDEKVFHALRARKDVVETLLRDLASARSLEPNQNGER